MTGISFPLLCAVFIFNIKLFMFQAFKNTRSYGECVRENHFLVSGMAGAFKRARTGITVVSLPETVISSLIPLQQNI